MTFTRRHFIATSSAALAAGAFGRIELFGPQAQAPITPVFRAIRRNAGFWTARGGTIGWLVNDAGAIAVDSQFPDTAQLCLDRLLKESGKAEIAALINTHHHGDHTGGNGVFRPRTKQIIGHANVPKYMQTTYDAAMARRARQDPPSDTPPPAEPAIPDRTFTHTWGIEHGNERVQITHYGPAHTGGDAVVRFERANVVHMGDLMFNRAHPVIDRANGASIANWIAVLERVAKELSADTVYIFGHAGPKHEVTGSRADLRHHANYLGALLDYVRAKVKAGEPREQIVASTDVLEGFADYGPLVARPLGPAYDEVTAAQ
jgi:cyclase